MMPWMPCVAGRNISGEMYPGWNTPCENAPIGTLVVDDDDGLHVYGICEQHQRELDQLGILDPVPEQGAAGPDVGAG